jgi:dTDP-4-dehydrorhamnose reductase
LTIGRVLITGASGQLGCDLRAQLGDNCEVAAFGRQQLDITDDEALAAAFEQTRPDTVVNCAAFHNVDVCEREVDRSFEVNARAVKRLADNCAAAGARLVHLSTNYVFSGDRTEPYTETDLPMPRSVYAISKLAGEHAALAYDPRALVVRTAGLYGLGGSASKGGNFATRMLERARSQDSLQMVADQRLTPTYTNDLAGALIEAIDRGTTGLLHLTNSGECSWHEFTEAIMELAGVQIEVRPVPTKQGTGAVARPLNGVLAQRAAGAAELIPLRPWRDALAAYMEAAGLLVAERAGGAVIT